MTTRGLPDRDDASEQTKGLQRKPAITKAVGKVKVRMRKVDVWKSEKERSEKEKPEKEKEKDLPSSAELFRIVQNQQQEIEKLHRQLNKLTLTGETFGCRILSHESLVDKDDEWLDRVFGNVDARGATETRLRFQIYNFLGMFPPAAAAFIDQRRFAYLCEEIMQFARPVKCGRHAMHLVCELVTRFDWNLCTRPRMVNTVDRGSKALNVSDVQSKVNDAVEILDQAIFNASSALWNSSGGTWNPKKFGRAIKSILRERHRSETQQFCRSYSLLVAMKDHRRSWKAARMVCKGRVPEEIVEMIANYAITHPRHRVPWRTLTTVFSIPELIESDEPVESDESDGTDEMVDCEWSCSHQEWKRLADPAIFHTNGYPRHRDFALPRNRSFQGRHKEICLIPWDEY
ncbi:MAG: hypothetical protein M1820_005476 [Bogoriella megaspora]|nr:MAG: hypothetical protein M1820_005476 [Bogoriella megaspora]